MNWTTLKWIGQAALIGLGAYATQLTAAQQVLPMWLPIGTAVLGFLTGQAGHYAPQPDGALK